MPRIIRIRYRNVRTVKPAPSYGGPRPGSLITVRRCQGGYSLPAGIPEGAVRVIDFDRTYSVSWKGREYQVCIGVRQAVNDPHEFPGDYEMGRQNFYIFGVLSLLCISPTSGVEASRGTQDCCK